MYSNTKHDKDGRQKERVSWDILCYGGKVRHQILSDSKLLPMGLVPIVLLHYFEDIAVAGIAKGYSTISFIELERSVCESHLQE